MAETEFDLLMIGFDEGLFEALAPMLAPLRAKRISTGQEFESFLETYQLPAGSSVFVSNRVMGMSSLEIAQALSSYFSGIHIFFVTDKREDLTLVDLKKNGFTESYYWPLDRSLVRSTLEEIKSRRGKGATRRFRAVKLVDVQPEIELPFEVRTFLPLNGKFVLLTASGRLSERKVDALKGKSINSLFVDFDHIEKFYEFTAERLIQSGNASNDGVSQTEKSERFQSSVRELFRSILDSGNETADFGRGRDLLEQSKKVVESYITKKTGLDMRAQLMSVAGEGGDYYSHAEIVSTVACLLSMATGIGQPEDLAIAGLFHDIGMTGLSDLFSPLELERLKEPEKTIYLQHPRLSLNMLKEKRITTTPEIAEIIEKHHERVDGKGFPAGLAAHRIPETAHVLAYADAFEFLTRRTPGKPAPQIEEVHRTISTQFGLHPDVIAKIGRFLIRARAAA